MESFKTVLNNKITHVKVKTLINKTFRIPSKISKLIEGDDLNAVVYVDDSSKKIYLYLIKEIPSEYNIKLKKVYVKNSFYYSFYSPDLLEYIKYSIGLNLPVKANCNYFSSAEFEVSQFDTRTCKLIVYDFKED